MRPNSAALLALAIVAALGACAEADGAIQGGGLTDAGRAAATPPAFTPDSGTVFYSCEGSGTTWTALYNDIFGPTGRPGSCSFRSNCHGTPDGAGAQTPSGIECFDRRGCRQSFFDKGFITPADFAAPEKSSLFLGLLRVRKPDGSVIGFMPQTPTDYVFSDACVERIKTWLREGAKDD